MKASFLSDEVIVTEVDDYLIKKIDEEKDEKKNLEGMKCWEKKLHHSTLEDYAKFSCIIRKYLESESRILCGL